jgi:rRNA-processing protein FCF1
MRKVILDTNFLLIPFTENVDIFSELERILDFKFQTWVLDKTIDELNKIMLEQGGKSKKAAHLGLELIKAKGIKIIKSKSDLNTDQFLINNTEKNDIIATQDKILKKALLNKKHSIIVLRKKKYLNMIEI